jgi:hypothetical protein
MGTDGPCSGAPMDGWFGPEPWAIVVVWFVVFAVGLCAIIAWAHKGVTIATSVALLAGCSKSDPAAPPLPRQRYCGV